jgi:hypothetical protein
MPGQEQMKKVPLEEDLLAPFLVLLVGKLTGWNQPAPVGGDPIYLTSEQTAALAAEGINLLMPYLPKEAAQQVAAAVEKLPRAHRGSPEQRLLSIGRFGGVIPAPSAGGNTPPGCCVEEANGRLVCVR